MVASAAPRELSDAEVFGTAQPRAESNTGPRELTDAEVFGTPTAAPSERGMGDIFGSAVSRGWSQNVGLLTEALPALAYSVAGNEAEAQRKLGEYQARLAEIAKTNPAVIESFSKIGSLGDAVTYLAEAVGENLPSMVPGLGGAGLGALAGRTIAKSAAGTAAGMTAGAVAGSAAQNIPETFADVAQETGQQRPGVAMAFGGLKAGLDAIPSVMALKRAFGPAITDKIAGNILKRMGIGAAEQFAAEGATEGAQEALDIAASKFVDDNREFFTKGNVIRIADAGLKGGLGGAALGAATGAIQRPGEVAPEPTPEPAPEPMLALPRPGQGAMTPDEITRARAAMGVDWEPSQPNVSKERFPLTEPVKPQATADFVNQPPPYAEAAPAAQATDKFAVYPAIRDDEGSPIKPGATVPVSDLPERRDAEKAFRVAQKSPAYQAARHYTELTDKIGEDPGQLVERMLQIPAAQFQAMPIPARDQIIQVALKARAAQQPGKPMQVQDTSGQGPTSAAPAPMEAAQRSPFRGAAENRRAPVQPTSAEIEAIERGQPSRREWSSPAYDPSRGYSQQAVGGSERPFPAGQDSSGLDFTRDQQGNPVDPRAGMFEQRAREQAAAARAAQQEEVRRKQEAYNNAREARRRQYADAEQYYSDSTDKKYHATPRDLDKDGNYPVDQWGFVVSTGGGPMRFMDGGGKSANQKAALWIKQHGQRRSKYQVFERANHPSGKGIGIVVTGRNEPPGGAGPGKYGVPATTNPSRARPSPAGRAEGAAPVAPTAQASGAAPVSPAAPQPAPASPQEPAAPKRAEPRAKKGRGPASLWEFIASRGGIKDTGGELKAMGITSKRLVPGAGPLVRANGLSYDAMREAVEEAGYIRSRDANATTTPRDLLDAIEKEMPYWAAQRGTKRKDTRIYAAADEGEAATRQQERADEQYDRRDELERMAGSIGLDYDPGISDADLERAINARVAEMEGDTVPSEPYQGPDDLNAGIPGFEPSIDRTEIGDQYVAPGAERIKDKELAERRAQKPLRSDAEQKPADEGLFDVEGRKQDGLFSRKAPGFYSALTDAVQNLSIKSAPAAQWHGVINNLTTKGVKQAEIDWSMIGDWLSKQTGPVTKDQVVQYLRDNEVQVEEVVRGAEDAPTKYGDYTLPGGENYRELLLTLPEKASTRGPKGWGDTAGGTSDSANYRSGHFNEPNIVAHVRFNERTDADGRRVLFIEEIQSDWHQQGKRQGYSNPAADKKALADLEADMRRQAKTYYSSQVTENDTPEERATAARMDQKLAAREDVASIASVLGRGLEYELAVDRAKFGDRRPPDAPFKTQWPELAFKRALRWAAENGFDRVAWTTGEQQADRYNLSKQVDSIRVKNETDGGEAVKLIDIYLHNSNSIQLLVSSDGRVTDTDVDGLKDKRLDEVVGKDMADKIMSDDDQIISGDGLKIGGAGMRGFYDKMLPAMASKLGKKYGASVGKTNIPTGNELGQEKRISAREDLIRVIDDYENDPKAFYATGLHADGLQPWNVAEVERIVEEGGTVYAIIGDNPRNQTVHSMDITPAMKASVMGRGMPMWAMGKRGRDDRVGSSGGEKVGATIQTRPETSEARKRATDSLRAILRKLAGDKVDVEVVDRIVGDDANFSDAGGYYTSDAGRRMIYIAMGDMGDMASILRHETIHALRDLGVISPKNWRALENQAAGWRKKFGIDKDYAGLGMSQEKMNEEGIAEAYAAWVDGRYKPVSVIENVFKQVKAFFEALRNWAQGNGWKTSADVFEAIEGGELSQAEFERMPLNRKNAFALSRHAAKNQARGVMDMIKSVRDFTDRLSNPLSTLTGWESFYAERGLTKGKIQAIQDGVAAMRDMIGLTGDVREQAMRYMTSASVSPDVIKDAKLRAKFVDAKKKIIDLGRDLVDVGIIPEDVYLKNKGAYLPRLYLKFLLEEEADRRAMGGGAKPSDMGYGKKRKDIPEDIRKILYGEIDDPGFLAARSISVVASDLAKLQLLQNISENSNWVAEPRKQLIEWRGKKYTPQGLKAQADSLRTRIDEMPQDRRDAAVKMADDMDRAALTKLKAQPVFSKDYKQIPDTRRWGALRGLWVRKEIYDDMQGTFAIPNPDPSWPEQLLGMGGWGTKITQAWKTGKVVLNPPSVVRNLMSGVVQANVLGQVPIRYLPVRYLEAAKDIAAGGKYWQIYHKYGGKGSAYAQNEMARINRDYLALQKAQGTGRVRAMARFKDLVAHIADKASDAYQLVETIGKVSVIIDAMERGKLSERDAMIRAEEAQFDYSNVPPWMRYLRNSPVGVPFITYAGKVLPALLKTAVTRPMAFTPYIALAIGLPMLFRHMNDIDMEEWEKLKKVLPEWARQSGVYILPIRDSAGRWHYLDMNYIMPWGMLTQAWNKTTDGKPGEALKGVGLFGAPLFGIATAITTGIDPFTNRPIVQKGDPPWRQYQDTMLYAMGMAMPPWLAFGDVNAGWAKKLWQAANNEAIDRRGNPTSTLTQALGRTVGINLYGLDPEADRQKAIRQKKFEIDEIKRRRGTVAKDQRLKPDEKKEYLDDLNTLIREKSLELAEYTRSTNVSPKLRVPEKQ